MNEKNYGLKSHPMTINIWNEYKGQEGENLARIIKPNIKEDIFQQEFFTPLNVDHFKRPPNIRDVGIPLSNKFSCTSS